MSKHTFSIGQAYASRRADSPQDYLDAALQAERFLARNAHETEEGIYWQLPGGAELDQTFYSGTAGILYFYLKLYETTGEERWRRIAEQGTAYLAAHWRDFLTAAPTLGLGTEKGLYFGLGGLALVLGEAYRVLNSDAAARAAKEITDDYRESAQYDEHGAYWSGSTALALDGGVILLLLQQYGLFRDDGVKELILSAGRHYLRSGKKRIGGGLEYDGFDGILPISMPNFEFGTSGAGFLLTLLYEFTGDAAYLNAAKACTEYLSRIRVRQAKGYLIPHDLGGPGGQPPVFYVSSCHGPAGTAKLYYRLYQLTGEEKWFDEIVRMVDGIEAVGAPERQSAGLWNNVCLCCGHAGLVQFFVGLYQADGSARWRDLAVRSASVLLGEKEDLDGGGANWPLAWERIKPEQVTTPLGYYDGAAGIGSALLQIYQSERGSFHWERLPDDPFPVEGKQP